MRSWFKNERIALSLLGMAILYTLVNLLLVNRFSLLAEDMVSYFLPLSKLQGGILFSSGSIPQFNPFQFNGSSLIGAGQSGVLFFPRYLYYLIALALGTVDHLNTVEVGAHMLAGSLGLFLLLRYLRLEWKTAVLASYAYATNGFMIQMSSIWQHVSGTVALIPYLLFFTIRTGRNDLPLAWLGLALTRALLFSLGYIQTFTYAFITELVAFALLLPSKKAVFRYGASLFLSGALMLPQFLPMVHTFVNTYRGAGGFASQFEWPAPIHFVLTSAFTKPCLTHFAEPCPTIIYFNILTPLFWLAVLYATFLLITRGLKALIGRRSLPVNTAWYNREALLFIVLIFLMRLGWAFTHFSSQQVPDPHALSLHAFYSYTLADTLLFTLVYFAFSRPQPQPEQRAAYWLILSLLTVLFAAGAESVLSYISYPAIQFFRWPLKWYVIFPACFSILTALLLNQTLKKLATPFFVIFMFSAVALNTSVLTSSLYNINPVLVAPSQVETKDLLPYLRQGRSIGVGNLATPVQILAFNMGSYYSLPQYGGYEPTAARTKMQRLIASNLDQSVIKDEFGYEVRAHLLQAYAVHNYVVQRSVENNYPFLHQPEFKKVYQNNTVAVYQHAKAANLASGSKNENLPVSFQGNDIRVETSGLNSQTGQQVVLAWYGEEKGFTVYADHQKVPFTLDLHKRIVVNIPAGTKGLIVRYHDPYFYRGLSIASLFLILVYLIHLLQKRLGAQPTFLQELFRSKP